MIGILINLLVLILMLSIVLWLSVFTYFMYKLSTQMLDVPHLDSKVPYINKSKVNHTSSIKKFLTRDELAVQKEISKLDPAVQEELKRQQNVN
jgi:hypothetical protein